MNHIAQYRNGLHNQLHHNPCPPIHNFTGRFPSPGLGPLPDNIMIPQITTEGTIQYHNAPLQPFISAPDNRQQEESDNSAKVSNQRKQSMIVRTFQPVTAIISSPSCTTSQENLPKVPDTGSCNDGNYKPPQSTPPDNHQFVQHCDQGPKNCVECYNLIKGESSGAVIKLMVDAATMTEQEEMDQTGNWAVVSNSSQQSNTKVTEYLSSLRQFLKVDHKITTHENKKVRQGDVRIVTSADGSKLFFCPECHAAYPDKNLLEPHLAAHKIERRFICSECGAGLKRKEHLDRHQLSHSEERPYSCAVCPKTFKRNEHLSRHSVIHSGLKAQKERPWICGVCGAAHVRKEHLERHQLTHTDERPFACPLCPKAFKHNEHLSRHLVIHSGHKTQERPWVCGVCGTGHARKEHLDRHQVTHSDLRPFNCPACPKTFKRNEHLTRHLVIHSGQKSELCRECGKMFYRKDHLRKHAESHHNKRNKTSGTSTASLPLSNHPGMPLAGNIVLPSLSTSTVMPLSSVS